MEIPAKSFAITLSLATNFSLFTLWFIDSWIKYPLFFFEIIVIILLFSIINGYDLRIIIKGRIPARNLPLSLILYLVLVFSSVTLLITSILQTSLGMLQIIISYSAHPFFQARLY